MSEKGVVSFVSLGCPKNLVDTEVMAGAVLTAGYDLSFELDEADVLVINTCAFIPPAREETHAAICDGIIWKSERPGRRLVVAGCLLQWDREKTFLNDYPEVDLWSGVDGAPTLAEFLAGVEPQAVRGVSEMPCYLYDENTPRLQLTAPHSAYVKIADGCNNRCSYCSIPNIRGDLRSRTLASVVKESENLLNNGVKELLLIAQDITVFGADHPERGENLAQLVRALDALPGEFWVRLLYTHPAHYTDELIDALKNAQKVIPYLDIPLQHINDTILHRMGRKVSRAGVETLLAKLRREIPGIAIRTTFITGFPGEGEAEMEELVQFVQEQKFDRLGVFAYSAEPNTPAADFGDQVPQEVAEARAARIMALQKEISRERNRKLVGSEMVVLVDDWHHRSGIARGYADAPDIDNVIKVTGKSPVKPGRFCRVKITGSKEFELQAAIAGGRK